MPAFVRAALAAADAGRGRPTAAQPHGWDPWDERRRAGGRDSVTRIGEGVYRVEIDGRAEIVYVAGPRDASLGVLERTRVSRAV